MPTALKSKPVINNEREGESVEKPRHNYFSLALKIVGWQLVAVLVVESTLALAGLGEEEIFKLDPTFGFVHMNNKHITWRSEGYSKSYFGADGMREPGLTIKKPANTFRVALLGDSMVESLQVSIDETFGRQIERKVTNTEKPVQVLNFATSGYSTAQEYLQLKRKVLNYDPNLVVVFYNHRDLFENWAPPDQTLTNVRPYALHLPGQPLTIDSSSVTQWSKSPRGKFLNSIEWLREHSRIWGLIAAWETQASFHDPVYRTVVGFLTQPVKTVKAAAKSLSAIKPDEVLAQYTPKRLWKAFIGSNNSSFKIKFYDHASVSKDGKEKEPIKASEVSIPKDVQKSPVMADKAKATKIDPVIASGIMQAPSLQTFPKAINEATAAKALADAKADADIKANNAGQDNYIKLMSRTLDSLLYEMDTACKAKGARLAIVIAPSRLALDATEVREDMMNLTYDKEIGIIKKLTERREIPFYNLQEKLEAQPKKEARQNFYAMHLTPQGHAFVTAELTEFISKLTNSEIKK
ncbi:MAG: SGNH/GDSL hydrolase family protein [Leptolyngbya sp.]|nr:SGNH/GDSL hydrolase family protein [Candidatus Melainabacteria bacterium]